MVKVYCKQDIVVIENSEYEFKEIHHSGSSVRLYFSDGTIIVTGHRALA